MLSRGSRVTLLPLIAVAAHAAEPVAADVPDSRRAWHAVGAIASSVVGVGSGVTIGFTGFVVRCLATDRCPGNGRSTMTISALAGGVLGATLYTVADHGDGWRTLAITGVPSLALGTLTVYANHRGLAEMDAGGDATNSWSRVAGYSALASGITIPILGGVAAGTDGRGLNNAPRVHATVSPTVIRIAGRF